MVLLRTVEHGDAAGRFLELSRRRRQRGHCLCRTLCTVRARGYHRKDTRTGAPDPRQGRMGCGIACQRSAVLGRGMVLCHHTDRHPAGARGGHQLQLGRIVRRRLDAQGGAAHLPRRPDAHRRHRLPCQDGDVQRHAGALGGIYR